MIGRRGLLGASLALAAIGAASDAHAQYPERGLTLIVPYGAGGGTDITARLLARDLEAVLGKPVTVENRAGGAGWIGWGALAAARPDGYTLGYLNVPSMYAGYLDTKVGRKESLDSFTPLMNHVIDYNVWAVKPDSPFKTVKDVVEAAKKTPDSVTVTAYGAGSDDHLAILGIVGRDRRDVRRGAQPLDRRGEDPGARRPRAGARRECQRGRRGGAQRAVAPARRDGAGALALPARTRRPSRSRASTRCGRSRAASRRPPTCRRTSRRSSPPRSNRCSARASIRPRPRG